MPLQIVRATKKDSKARLALLGPSGAGKTYTALEIALGMARLEEIGLIDTEHRSSEKYAPIFGEFAVIHLDNFDPRIYVEAIELLASSGFKVIIIDSLSHAWAGKGGALELKDRATQRNGGNSYTAWSAVTPLQNQLIDTIIGAPAHVIVTLRAKQDYVQEYDERTRKQVVRRLGLAPIQRDGMEYEFDVVAEMDLDNVLTVTKTRCPDLKGLQLVQPTRALGRTLLAWVSTPAPEETDDEARPAGNLVTLPGRATEQREWAAPAATGPGEPPPTPSAPARPDEPDDVDFAEQMARDLVPADDEEDEAGLIWWPAPQATAYKCQAVACEFTYKTDDEIVFGGRRFRGRTLAERTLADAEKPLCAPHAKAWSEGIDVLTQAVTA